MGNTTTQNALIKKMTDMGIPISFINAHPELKNGSWIDPQDVSKYVNLWNSQESARKAEEAKLAELDARTPDFLKNDPNWASLPYDMREVAVYNYEIQKANDEQKARALAAALEQATAQAEPYWRNIIMIAQDEVLRSFEQAQGDYDSSVQRQLRIIDNIKQDLTSNKEFLTLEQQSDLANISRSYSAEHEGLIDSAAASGLTFSTKRKLAEQKLAEQNKDIVESTNRQYNKQVKDLQENASRGTSEALQNLGDMQRKLGETKTDIGRSAETRLGTDNLPALPGYAPLGNQPGSLYEEKVKDISERQGAIYSDLTSAGNLNL